MNESGKRADMRIAAGGEVTEHRLRIRAEKIAFVHSNEGKKDGSVLVVV